MKIYTSNFGNLRKLREKFILPIAIVRYAPKWYDGFNYQRLAPTSPMLSYGEPEYRVAFGKLLNHLNPHAIVGELTAISGGKDIALLCYEKDGEFCHRHLVADWLKANGYDVTEFGGGCSHTPIEELSLF